MCMCVCVCSHVYMCVSDFDSVIGQGQSRMNECRQDESLYREKLYSCHHLSLLKGLAMLNACPQL